MWRSPSSKGRRSPPCKLASGSVLMNSGREVPVDPEFQSWASQHLSGGTQCGRLARLCGVCRCCSCVIPAVTHVPAVTRRAQANPGRTALGAVRRSSAPCSALLGAGVSCGRPAHTAPIRFRKRVAESSNSSISDNSLGLPEFGEFWVWPESLLQTSAPTVKSRVDYVSSPPKRCRAIVQPSC